MSEAPTASAGAPAVRLPTAWLRRADELRDWTAAHGRLPFGRSDDAHERRLAVWLARQRRRLDDPSFAAHRTYLDAEVPRWRSERPVHRWHEPPETIARYPTAMRWWTAALEAATFVEEHGRVPSRAAVDKVEQRLARWLTDERRVALMMNQEVQSALARLLPGWLAGGWDVSLLSERERAWRENALRLGDYVSSTGRWPSQASTDPAERRLARWLTTARAATGARRGVFATERRRFLDEHVPGWRRQAPPPG